MTRYCKTCDKILSGGEKYLIHDYAEYCLSCFEDKFCSTCIVCSSLIQADDRDISYKDDHFHEQCFACYECGKSLVKRTFAHLEDKQLYVCSTCFENTFCDHCDKCQTVIKPGSKKVEYESRTYHNDCFCCSHCKDPIGRLPFVNKKAVITCLVCYENHVAGKKLYENIVSDYYFFGYFS